MSLPQRGPLRAVLFTGSTTAGNGTSQWIDVQGYSHLCFYLKTNGTPGAGTCVLEEADFDPTTGMPTALTGSTLTTVTITSGVGNSAQAAFHYTGAFSRVRARIGTTVTDTTLDAVLVAS